MMAMLWESVQRILWHYKGIDDDGVADSPERRDGLFATSRCNGNPYL